LYVRKFFRRGSMRGQRTRQTCISTKKASIRVPKPMRWVMELVSYSFLLTSIVNQCHILLEGGSKGFRHQTLCRSIVLDPTEARRRRHEIRHGKRSIY
uniref:Uncharacterized protein n=1 Tax=Aegilops tauschii subsp. strangulata TaxID=200361 RepID=A0A453K1Y3_AEGTS